MQSGQNASPDPAEEEGQSADPLTAPEELADSVPIDKAVEDVRREDEEHDDETSPRAKAYDPAEDRERTRGRFAIGLLWLLTFTTLSICLLVAASVVPFDALTATIFPSLVTLTGTVLGFYFGEKRG
jgi:hypothetical protein